MSNQIINLKDLLADSLVDLLSVKTQIALLAEKMSRLAHDKDLKAELRKQQGQAQKHIDVLAESLRDLDLEPTPRFCSAVAGLIAQGDDLASRIAKRELRDAALVSTLQRLQQYCVAVSRNVSTYAGSAGLDEMAKSIDRIGNDQDRGHRKLSELVSKKVNGRTMARA